MLCTKVPSSINQHHTETCVYIYIYIYIYIYTVTISGEHEGHDERRVATVLLCAV